MAPLSNGVEQAAGVTRPKHCLCIGGLHTGRRESTDSDLIPDAMSIWRDEKAAMSRRPDHTAQWVSAGRSGPIRTLKEYLGTFGPLSLGSRAEEAGLTAQPPDLSVRQPESVVAL